VRLRLAADHENAWGDDSRPELRSWEVTALREAANPALRAHGIRAVEAAAKAGIAGSGRGERPWGKPAGSAGWTSTGSAWPVRPYSSARPASPRLGADARGGRMAQREGNAPPVAVAAPAGRGPPASPGTRAGAGCSARASAACAEPLTRGARCSRPIRASGSVLRGAVSAAARTGRDRLPDGHADGRAAGDRVGPGAGLTRLAAAAWLRRRYLARLPPLRLVSVRGLIRCA
jgi:hypothetical protein